MRICSTVASGVLLVASLHAAETTKPKAHAIKSVVKVDRRTGKLTRQVVQPSEVRTEAQKALAQSFDSTVTRIAAEHSLPPELVHSVIQVESNYNPYAVSPKGALGMMQLIPSTARRFGVQNVFDPEENIKGGARYLRYLLDLYGGDSVRALAAYNAGEGAVARYGSVPPFPETQVYVREVSRRVEESKAAAAPPPAAPAVAAKAAEPEPEPGPERPRAIYQIVTADGKVRYVTQ